MIIKLYGEVISDDWDWLYSLFGIPHCCPKNVRDAIEQLPADENLILEVNSPGGDVWAGFEIYGLLQQLAGRTEAHIIAMAASAATTITSACSRVLASPVAQFMIHQPSAFVYDYLNNEDSRRLSNFLDSVRASIINGYVVKSAGKATRKTFEKLVDDCTWMPVQNAMDLGLVDGFLDTSEESNELLSAGGGLRLSNAAGDGDGLKELLTRYEEGVRNGTLQEVPGHPVSRKNAETEADASTGEAAADGKPITLTVSGGDFVRGVIDSVYASGEITAPLPVLDSEPEEADEDPDWQKRAAIELERERGIADDAF